MKYLVFLTIAGMILSSALATSEADAYFIRPGDHLSLTVLGEAELSKRVVVNSEGDITLPLVNDVHVAGLTTLQASREIAAQLRHFLKNPQVNVELIETAKLQVTVSGEVRSPGIYTLERGARLLDAITSAGGYTPAADLSQVTITRADVPGAASIVDLSKFLLSGDTSANVIISTGDTVIVPARESNVVGTVTILGAVRRAGEHPITRGMTLREAVMLAGGPTEFADLSKVSLRREGSSDVTVNYASAAAGDASANPELKPGDVIYIAAREQMGYYTIQGAVGSPGRYELRESTTITEAIAIAGGVGDRARLSDVSILRTSDGATRTLRANVSDIMVGKAENLPVHNGDSIFVPARSRKPDLLRILSVAISVAWLVLRK